MNSINAISSTINSVGNHIDLKVTNPKHISASNEVRNADHLEKSFAEVLENAVVDLNDLQHNAHNMLNLMITNPESVNAHDVSIALTKAEVSMHFFKSIADRVITAYRELTNIR